MTEEQKKAFIINILNEMYEDKMIDMPMSAESIIHEVIVSHARRELTTSSVMNDLDELIG